MQGLCEQGGLAAGLNHLLMIQVKVICLVEVHPVVAQFRIGQCPLNHSLPAAQFIAHNKPFLADFNVRCVVVGCSNQLSSKQTMATLKQYLSLEIGGRAQTGTCNQIELKVTPEGCLHWATLSRTTRRDLAGQIW